MTKKDNLIIAVLVLFLFFGMLAIYNAYFLLFALLVILAGIMLLTLLWAMATVLDYILSNFK